MAPCSFILCSILTFAISLYGISAITYQVTNTVPNTPGGMRFNKEIGIPYTKQVMEQATNFIWSNVLLQKNPAERKPISVVNTYIIHFKEEDHGDAYTWGVYNINYSELQIAKFNYQGPMKWDLKKEFTHIIYHEITHVLQWGGGGNAPAPGGLTEGIADYTLIKAKMTQPDFVKPGEGDKWDQGYDWTARFLEYCDGITPDFVAKLNNKMKSSYNVAYWKELTGKPLEQLWKEYKAKYGKKEVNT